MIADSHLHFDYLESAEQDVVLRSPDHFALSAGVWPDETHRATELFDKTAGRIFWAAGLHPAFIPDRYTNEMDRQRAHDALLQLAADSRIYAIGETGFDLSKDVVQRALMQNCDSASLAILQAKAFDFCAELAERHSKPLILHSRQAWLPTMQAIERVRKRNPRLPIMIHCFPGAAAEIRKLSELGVYLSFGGVITWPSAKRIKEALRACPGEWLLLETDAPDLAPVLADGTRPSRNSPVLWRRILEVAATLRGENEQDLAKSVRHNLAQFLGHRF